MSKDGGQSRDLSPRLFLDVGQIIQRQREQVADNCDIRVRRHVRFKQTQELFQLCRGSVGALELSGPFHLTNDGTQRAILEIGRAYETNSRAGLLPNALL